MADDGSCKIRPTPFEPCPFHATPGPVGLTVINVTGTVTFLKADYEGGPVNVTPNAITFTLVAGQKNLDVTYFFSDTVAGRGALHEVCPGNTFLGDVDASVPFVRYVICA
jgi:hypothetical protein